VTNVHADWLELAATRLGLAQSIPVEEGPTHFPYNPLLEPTVIDLVYIPEELSLRVHHHICPDIRGTSDHTPLLSELPTPDFEFTKYKCYIKPDTPAYTSWIKDMSAVLAALGDKPPPGTPVEIDDVVQAMSAIFSKVWDTHADFVDVTRNSKKWWNGSCAKALAMYQTSRLQEDWAEFHYTTWVAKCIFFNHRIQDIAVKKARPWDLASWVKQCQLPSYEAISFRGQPCNNMDSLWGALDGTYNTANGRPVDLGILDTVPSLPVREWMPFSMLELTQALHACSSTSAPGPDHVTWGMLKTLAANPHIASLFLGLVEVCIQLGHWPAHFKESLLVIIPKPGKLSYSTPKSFHPIVLLNMLGKLVEKMLSHHMQYDGVQHGAFQPNQFGGISQCSTEDAGVFLTHLIRAGWAKKLKTSIMAFDIVQFFPSLNHDMLMVVIQKAGFPLVLGNFFRPYLTGHKTMYKWDNSVSGC